MAPDVPFLVWMRTWGLQVCKCHFTHLEKKKKKKQNRIRSAITAIYIINWTISIATFFLTAHWTSRSSFPFNAVIFVCFICHVSFMKTDLTLNCRLFWTHTFLSPPLLHENVHFVFICRWKTTRISAENREAENQVTALARLKRSVLVNLTKIIYYPAKGGEGTRGGMGEKDGMEFEVGGVAVDSNQ